MTIKAGRSWLWVTVIVLSGVCSGMTGLYTGSSLTASKYEDRILNLRRVYQEQILTLQTEHKNEMVRLDRDTASLSVAISALAGKVGQVNEQVAAVSNKVDQTVATTAKTHEEIKAAAQQSKLAVAKTEILTAKVQEASSAPRTVILVPKK